MPALSPQEIIDAIIDAIEQSGGNAVYTSSQVRIHPRQFAIELPETSEIIRLWVYAWTLTPGGRPQLKNEYRIQMTSVESPLELNPHGPTVLLGYEPGLNMFAGFDIQLHKTFTPGSSSVQINIASIHKALQDGLSFHRKENSEVTVGIRPDHLLTYVCNAPSLHETASSPETVGLLSRASALQEIPLSKLKLLSRERRRLVQTVSRASRSANFREVILNAYAHRCAVTRLQMRLVEAAHILPVAAPGSIDQVQNGIALSPTYHRAYDHGLIFIDSDYVMRINPKREHRLRDMNLVGGLTQFKASLGKIHLPADRQQWPHLDLIQQANSYRRIET